MSRLCLKIQNSEGLILAETLGNDGVNLVYDSEYAKGDVILFETDMINDFYILQLDDALGTNFVYITKNVFKFTVPSDDKKTGYSPKAFAGMTHLLSARRAMPHEIASYKNLAYNVYDEHGDTGCFPHVTANIETRNEPAFFARCVIDGIRENKNHGIWPYCSWGIDRRPDAKITLDFGRNIRTDKIILVTRADFPHDSFWTQATLEFSDGSKMEIRLSKTAEPQTFTFEPKITTKIKLFNLIKSSDDPSPFPALSQWEVYGCEAE